RVPLRENALLVAVAGGEPGVDVAAGVMSADAVNAQFAISGNQVGVRYLRGRWVWRRPASVRAVVQTLKRTDHPDDRGGVHVDGAGLCGSLKRRKRQQQRRAGKQAT